MNKLVSSLHDTIVSLNAPDNSLSALIHSKELEFVMEAHDGLSAAIAAQAGFKALWASGLSISSSLGYRDANEASWTQMVDVVERMDPNDRLHRTDTPLRRAG
ncbi:phosphoenolpyruvate phosphomutase [Agrobacterium sp. DSM 25558]|nr:phosphoenolpyruvate phosphomutase [Agrobacterium sp. DSM 25558]